MGCTGAKKCLPESDTFFKDYTLGKKLGEGAFGQVRLACHTRTKESVAVKIADVRSENTDSSTPALNSRRKAAVENEMEMWALASQEGIPQITRLHECFYSSGFYYMVCEACKRNLMQHLLQVKSISEDELGEVASQMLKSISHVHGLGLVHRDIKPENFLYGGPDATVLKLCDFGLALRQPKKGKGLYGIGGTAPYMAPEILATGRNAWPKQKGYSKEVDLWALGVIIYLVVYGQFPYMPKGEPTADSMKQAILHDYPPISFPKTQAQAALGLVRKLLVREAKHRATAEVASQDPFITKAAASSAEMKVSLEEAKEMAENLRDFKVSASTQLDLERKLKAITAARGGTWFSEEAFSPSMSQSSLAFRESRIKKDKKPVTRDKFGTHSGIVSEEIKDS